MRDNTYRVNPIEGTYKSGYNEFRNRYRDPNYHQNNPQNNSKNSKRQLENDTFESILRKSFQENQESRKDNYGSR